MRMSEYLQKRKLLFIITIIILIIIMIVSIYTFIEKHKYKDNIQEQDLKVTYNISKENGYPMDKETGAEYAKESSVIIKNNKNYSQKYKLIIKPDENSTLELNKIYILIDNEIKLLSELNDGVAYQGNIKSNEEVTITFKNWVGLDLITTDDYDKIVNLKYDVIKD